MAISTGPAIRVVCRILNQNSCGSGSICGNQPDGKALIMTNAHVAGTQLGRVVKVWVESQNQTLDAKVILAAYSDSTSSDWALLETLAPYTAVKPVKLSKNRPSGSHHTKGFPRCQQHGGTDITTVRVDRYVWYWEPDAIGGQSGSGVWSDTVERQEGLLTWQWGAHGAGQPTAAIYGEMTSFQLMGTPLPPGMVRLTNDYDFSGLQRGDDDPVVEEGFFSQAGIRDYPIWWQDSPVDPPVDPPIDPPAGNQKALIELLIDANRRNAEFHTAEIAKLQKLIETQGKPFDPSKVPPGVDTSGLFGL